MARPKKEEQQTQNTKAAEREQANPALTPLPGEEPKKAAPEPKKTQNSKAENAEPEIMYGFCRISGGLCFDLTADGKAEKVILKSANTTKVAPDGTRTFEVKPDEFGVTEVPFKLAQIIMEQYKNYGPMKKGFVFFSASKEEGYKRAAKHAALYKRQGTEQLSEEDIAREVARFTED